jgi:transcriptional regulator GlxA family with amidase domain
MELNQTMPHASRQRASLAEAGKTTRIDIAMFNGFALPGIAVIMEIFQKANEFVFVTPGQTARSRYDVSLWSAAGGRIASSSSVFVWTEDVNSHRGTNDAHLLFIAGGVGAQQACQDERLRVWLRSRHPFSEVVHPIAEGRLLLEAAGLPSRYRPLCGADRKSAYPPGTIGETPGAVPTALRIVEEDLGPDAALLVAESVATEHKSHFGSSITDRAAPQVSEKIMASARWLQANIDQPISIDDAARIAAMSERNFLRRFRSEMGMTPSDYLLHTRLNMSCRMLVESRLPVDKIARRCGIGSGSQLAKLFRKYLATTPTAYRMGREVPTNSN